MRARGMNGRVRRGFQEPAGTAIRLELAGNDGTVRTVSLTLRDDV